MSAPVTVPIVHTTRLAEDESRPSGSESVAAILKRCKTSLIADWLARTKNTSELNHLHLSDKQRTGHLPKLIDDIVMRLGNSDLPTKNSDASASAAAVEHGNLRRMQGYTPCMLIHDSRILQVTIFGTLQNNVSSRDFKLLLPDVMTIADEVDSQLAQTMASLLNAVPKFPKAHLVKPATRL